MIKYIKKNKLLILCILIILPGFLLLIYNKRLDIGILIGDDKSIHLSLLTVNSIIGGFMFSGLSLIVGASGSKVVEDMERAKYMDEVYNSIFVGLTSNILSILLSLMIVLSAYPKYTFHLVAFEVSFLICSICCFIISSIKLWMIISRIRKSINIISDDVIDRVIERSNRNSRIE